MNLSDQQSAAITAAGAWYKSRSKPFFYLAGYAGTGKTTIAKEFAEMVTGKVRYAAFSGKAAMVMRKNGCVDASTIHSMIYKVDINEATGQRTFTKRPKHEMSGVGLIIIDECSMVGNDIGADLLSFKVPVLVLGDPGQLPPVSGGGAFTGGDPDYFLDQIHRQAADSPIVRMATDVREGRQLASGVFGASKVIPAVKVDGGEVMASSQVIVGMNRTRKTYNGRMRQLQGYEGDMPNLSERLICLKNDHNAGIYNGSMWEVCDVKKRKKGQVEDNCINMAVKSLDFDGMAAVDVSVRREFFNGEPNTIDWQELRGTHQFDFGYAITTHKAQGSQWDDVYLFDESKAFAKDRARWLYTAITRAAERITVVV